MRYLIAILALAGVVVSALALHVHYCTGTEPCSINEKWDCGIVNHSPFAEVAGTFRWRRSGSPATWRWRAGAGGGGRWSFWLRSPGWLCPLSEPYRKDVLMTWCLYCVISQGSSLLTAAQLGPPGCAGIRVAPSQKREKGSEGRFGLDNHVGASSQPPASSRASAALIKLKQSHVQREIRALDVRVGDAADHARRKSRGAPAGVGLRVD
jgi:vitamin-K-epoxide reductase (warfarin-sensitive)